MQGQQRRYPSQCQQQAACKPFRDEAETCHSAHLILQRSQVRLRIPQRYTTRSNEAHPFSRTMAALVLSKRMVVGEDLQV
jgi:hypothetical protein